MMTRQDHLLWCKQRALQYVDAGDVNGAFASISSDLAKHPETEGHIGIILGMQMMMSGQIKSQEAMRNFINGFK